MKKLFLIIVTLFVFSTSAFAAVNINTAGQAELETLQGIGPGQSQGDCRSPQEEWSFQIDR